MNSQLDMVVWGTAVSNAQLFFQRVDDAVDRLENVLSRYKAEAELWQLNHSAFEKPFRMSQQLYQAVLSGIDYYQQTGGYFDVFNGEAYHRLKKGELPFEPTAQTAQKRVNVDHQQKSIHFLQSGVSIDFGGMGKGLALQEVDKLLSEQAIEHAFFSFGGSSILTRGHHPHGAFWPFALASRPEKVWQLNDAFLSVSQTTAAHTTEPKQHLIDPKTGAAINEQHTAVVLAANPVDAEVLSTSLLIAPANEHPSILQNLKALEHQIF
jgi:FAD:protein FMN transferase